MTGLNLCLHNLECVGLVKNLAPSVEMTEFVSSFAVTKSAVGVLASNRYSTRSPPTVSRTQFGSSSCSL
eukprot:1252202-Ditylum_brightwellii.AAC.1